MHALVLMLVILTGPKGEPPQQQMPPNAPTAEMVIEADPEVLTAWGTLLTGAAALLTAAGTVAGALIWRRRHHD